MRDEKKVVHWVRREIPHASEEAIVSVLESLHPKDRYRMSKGEHSKHYYYPIYTPFRGGYQMDLLQQSNRTDDARRKYPAYFFIAINVNTRYGYAYPCKNKDTATVLGIIAQWVDEVRNEAPLLNISADQEGAWRSKEADDWFKNHSIVLNLIDHDRHSALGVIDRFIRTLRDMNVRTEDSKHETKERRFRDFTRAKMAKLIEIYNNSLHSGIGMTPSEMAHDAEAEKQYRIDKLYEVERRHKIIDYELPANTWVRFMVPRDPMHKRRFQVSQEFVWVAKKQGNSYVCMARDGTIKRISRWRLFAYSSELPEGGDVLESWHNNYGVIGKVVGGPRLDTAGAVIYKVNWQTPPGFPVQKDRWDTETLIRGQTDGSDLIAAWLREKETLRRVDIIVNKNGELYEVKWDKVTDEYNTDETETNIRNYPGGIAALDAFKNNQAVPATHVAVPIPRPAFPRGLKVIKIRSGGGSRGFRTELSDGRIEWMPKEDIERIRGGKDALRTFEGRK
jgi:hypothetical protein